MHSDEPRPYKIIAYIKHKWMIEEVDCPGPKYYWICRRCGACGGPSFLPWEQLEIKKPTWVPFLSGTPLINLSTDNCDEAKKQVDEFVVKYPEWGEYADRARGRS